MTPQRILTPTRLAPPSALDSSAHAHGWSGLEELRPALLRFLMRHCRDENEAEDLIQETFVRAARYRRDLCQHSRLRAWLMQIAANVFRDHVRRGQRGPLVTIDEEVLEDVECPTGGSVRESTSEVYWNVGEHKVEVETLLGDLRLAVNELRDRDRRLLEDYYSGGESTATIAGRQGVSAALVKVRLFRARRRLERSLCQRAAQRRAMRLLEFAG